MLFTNNTNSALIFRSYPKSKRNIIGQYIDFFNGEMEEEGKTEEGYQTEWDQFMYGDGDPIETKTWWGGALRGLTHYGTLAAVPVGKIGVLAKAGKLGKSVVPAVIKTPAFAFNTSGEEGESESE